MPRHGSNKDFVKKSDPARAPRERSDNDRKKPGRSLDQEVLALREGGASYSAIARRLDLRRATDAHRAFVRAMHASTEEEQARIEGNEQARLDQLETRIRERDASSPEKVESRLAGVALLRSAMSR